MKKFKYLVFSISTVILLCAATAPLSKYILAPDYNVTIHGSSNLHDWDETVGKVTGDGIINWNADGSFDLNSINIKMDVESIKGDMGSVMNNKTHKALKSDTYPQISFILSAPVKSVKANATANTLSAKGTLTIAGVTKPVIMQVKLSMQGQNKLAFEGAQTIRMTDYGVDPPTALFGALKTADEITISFKTNFIASNQ